MNRMISAETPRKVSSPSFGTPTLMDDELSESPLSDKIKELLWETGDRKLEGPKDTRPPFGTKKIPTG